jgi:hypothetical protein
MPATSSPKNADGALRPFWTPVVMAALLGAACGLAAATWPVSLKNGQALAGRIPFVANRAWNVYLFRLCVLINQLTAGLLVLFALWRRDQALDAVPLPIELTAETTLAPGVTLCCFGDLEGLRDPRPYRWGMGPMSQT